MIIINSSSNKMETVNYYNSATSSSASSSSASASTSINRLLCQQQNQNDNNLSTLSLLSSPLSTSLSSSTTNIISHNTNTNIINSNINNNNNNNNNNNHGKESIHSGQFMISHFEAEAQDDDDTEIKMPDPDDPNYQKPDDDDDINLCTDIQLYVPQKLNQLSDGYSTSIITSHLEIETSLTKLFKCMNLAYRQKLTSPKWNHFKGVRLRWKDKIRLNNVIWRCWHMQFILKKRTPVCQFASPLDVDIHSNPQSVVLEGKYWKRQLSVIKAEYRKWRRNSKTKAIGYCFDTKSEFDFLEWSPLSNDRNLMITEDWTSDTLFSAINVPFPFPDPREIARGAGIADFIQPSLGPLQPNLDDIDITFQELLQSARLPPVPEEGTDDILKNVDYNFPAIMGSEQLDSVNLMDVTNASTAQQQQQQQQQQQAVVSSTIEDATMVDINNQLNPLQQYTEKLCSTDNNMEIQQSNSNVLDPTNTQVGLTHSNLDIITGYSDIINETTSAAMNTAYQLTKGTTNQLVDLQSNSGISSMAQLNSAGKNNILKGRISKTFNRSFRKREPHNYDKAQPTLHQTNIYQQMLAEQQQQQQQTQKQQQHQQQQQQCQIPMMSSNMQFTSTHQFPPPAPSNVTTNSVNSDMFSVQSINNNTLNLSTVNASGATMKSYSIPQTTPQNSNLINHKPLSASSEILSILNVDNANVHDLYKAAATGSALSSMHPSNSLAYKTFTNTNAQNLKKLSSSSSSMGFINILSSGGASSSGNSIGGGNMRQLSPTTGNKSIDQFLMDQLSGQQLQHQHQQQQQQDLPTKEMYRSNSLPLNSSLQKFESNKDEMFVIPKIHSKNNRSRTRSSSTHQPSLPTAVSNFPAVTALQTTTSEPMLNSTLAQLLTTNSSNKLSVKQSSAPATLSQNALRISAYTGSAAVSYQQQQQQQQQLSLPTQQQQQMITANQLSLSPTRSTSLPQPVNLHSPPLAAPKMMSFPPCLSPDSFTDDSPLSPTKSGNLNNLKYIKDSQRRVGHIHAEQKRRYNIKNGFDMLHSLIPQLQQNPNAKLSKAAMLQKGAEYIKQLRIERNIINDKMDSLKKERDNLNASLSHLHSILPANGAPVSRQRTERVKQLYSQYVRYRTMQNWKFWILGLILEPLLSSYTTSVSMASMEELYRTALLWVEQHCSLVELRPAVSNKLRYLSMTTDILSDPPSTLQEEVHKAINNTDGQHPNLNGT